jgi:hypothetical protein
MTLGKGSGLRRWVVSRDGGVAARRLFGRVGVNAGRQH